MDKDNNQIEKSVTLKDLLFIIKKNIWMILIITFLTTAAAAVYGLGFKPITYKASATALVDNNNASSGGGSSSEYQNYILSTYLMNTFKDFVVSDLVLKDTVETLKTEKPDRFKNLTLNTIKANLSVSVSTSNSLILTTTFKYKNGEDAVDIVNQVLASTVKIVNEKDEHGEYKMKVLAESFVIIDSAEIGNVTSSRGASVVILIGFFGGFVLAFVIGLIKYLADDTYTSKEEFEAAFDVNVLSLLVDVSGNKDEKGNILTKKKKKLSRKEAIFYNNEGYSVPTEAINRLKDNILFAALDGKIKTIQFESSMSGEAKTTTAANLAVALGACGKKVVVVDLDFRKPRVHRVFNIENKDGISDYLLNNVDYSSLLKKTEYENVTVINRGTEVQNPTSVLMSNKLADLVKKLREENDFVILDCPPVLMISDYISISSLADGVIFNVHYGETKKAQVRESISLLKNNNINIIGANFTFYDPKRSNSNGAYDYYGYYSYEYGDKNK